MDLRVLCVFVAVAYVDVIALITCNFQPKSWTSAMQHCLNLNGTPVGISTVWSVAELHLNGSFWTADYVSRIQTTYSPVECEYRTLSTGNQISQAKLGNCDEIRHYICCDQNMIKPCVKNGTWQEAYKCTETYSTQTEQLPVGDYWIRRAFGHQFSVYTGDRLQSIAQCGRVDVNTTFQFVSDCTTSHYSFVKLVRTLKSNTGNYSGSDLSVCGPTNIIKQPSSCSPSTSLSQTIDTLTETIASYNETTSTESLCHNHASSSSGSALGIGLGVSLSIVIIVIITTVSVCVYKRRQKRKPDSSQVSVRINALYDVSGQNVRGQNETPRKPEHTHESYVYAVPIRKNDGNRHVENGIGNELADMEVYSKATTNTHRNSNTVDVQSRKESHKSFTGDTTVYGHTGVISDEYDGVNFSDAPDPINMNVYSHLGNHDHEDAYNVASCTQTQQTPSMMSDYDRLDVH